MPPDAVPPLESTGRRSSAEPSDPAAAPPGAAPDAPRRERLMSGPNSDYDPVEVTPLKAEEVEAMRDAALAAIDAAADLDQLKEVRLAHAGDRSPLALANREIGALPPQARKEAAE